MPLLFIFPLIKSYVSNPPFEIPFLCCLLQFPSMAYIQGGGLPHVSIPRGFPDSTNPAADSVVVMASQSPFYTSALSPNSPSLASNLSPGEAKLFLVFFLVRVYSKS